MPENHAWRQSDFCDDSCDLVCHLVDSAIGATEGNSVGKRRAVLDHLVLRHAMPDRKNDLGAASCQVASDEAVEFVVCPALREERLGLYDDTEATVGEAPVDALPEA